ncbi:DUF309 domain-containing protein [Paenibacillus sp. strain BS8-2]
MRYYPSSYIAYLVQFHATRDYFECHELLEEYWKEHPDDGHGDLWVGLIQLAVGQYHERRGNLRGAGRMYSESLNRLSHADWNITGLRSDVLLEQLRVRLAAVNEVPSGKYEDMQLEIEDDELLRLCLEQCASHGLVWTIASPMDNEQIIHRHKLRDRSDVIAARAASLKMKQDRREIK